VGGDQDSPSSGRGLCQVQLGAIRYVFRSEPQPSITTRQESNRAICLHVQLVYYSTENLCHSLLKTLHRPMDSTAVASFSGYFTNCSLSLRTSPPSGNCLSSYSALQEHPSSHHYYSAFPLSQPLHSPGGPVHSNPVPQPAHGYRPPTPW